MQIELTSFNEFVVGARAIEPRQRDRLPRLSVSSDCKLDPTTIFSRRSPAFITSRLSSFTLFFFCFFFFSNCDNVVHTRYAYACRPSWNVRDKSLGLHIVRGINRAVYGVSLYPAELIRK